MKIYTVLAERDPESLTRFAQTCLDCGATGVTIFTRPHLIAPVPPPGQPTVAELQAQADQAAAAKRYRQAAEFEQKIENLKVDLEDQAKQAAQWIREATKPINQITQLVVLGNLHWAQDKPFTTENLMAQLGTLSSLLLSTGVGGIVQRTPLANRTFIPLVTPVAGGSSTQGDTAAAVNHSTVVSSPTRHPLIPASLPEKQAQYATYRLGLDRGGARRSKQEAGNLMGWSPNITGSMESKVQAAWPDFEARVNDNTQKVER